MNVFEIQDQIDRNRRSVAFDSYDITVKQISDMLLDGIIDIAPEYQRHFVWDEERQSHLIESLLLGIPVPSLFMATNKDSTWEVVDGVQRLTTIINFIFEESSFKNLKIKINKLKLSNLEKLNSINNLHFEDLPKSVQLMFLTRPIRITVLNDRSDFDVRFDLFERLNTGGVSLHPQEIRNCVFIGEFNDFIKECSTFQQFRNVVKMTKNAERNGSFEELVLRFFAYLEYINNFNHGVTEFLNKYMKEKTSKFKNRTELSRIFTRTFGLLNSRLPDGIVRGNRRNISSIILYEAISVGVANAIKTNIPINESKIEELLNDPTLKKYTTGATNTRSILLKRIEYVQEAITR